MFFSHLLLRMMEPLVSLQLLLPSSGAAYMALAVALHLNSNAHRSEQGRVPTPGCPRNAEVLADLCAACCWVPSLT